MTNYRPDYFLIILTFAGIVVGFVELIRKPQAMFPLNKTTHTVAIGILLIMLSVILAGLIEKHWDADYIISLLCLKKISFIGFAHAGIFVSFGYIFIVLGVATILLRTRPIDKIEIRTPVDFRSHQSKTKPGQKVYINARMSPKFSYVIEYVIPIIIFLLLPLALIYYFIAYLIITGFEWTIITLIVSALSLFAMALDVMLYFILRKNWVKEIIIDDLSILLLGFFKKIHAPWSDVLSAEIDSSSFSKRIKVKTRRGDFLFPLTMKEKGQEYPKIDSLYEQWMDADGNKRPVNPDNCVLYAEIKKYLIH